MCKEAKISVEEWIENSGTLEIPDQYGVNHLMLNLRKDDLDAKLITENWYQYHYNYNYNEEPSTHLPTSKFIALHILPFLELLVKYFIEYRKNIYTLCIYIYLIINLVFTRYNGKFFLNTKI